MSGTTEASTSVLGAGGSARVPSTRLDAVRAGREKSGTSISAYTLPLRLIALLVALSRTV